MPAFSSQQGIHTTHKNRIVLIVLAPLLTGLLFNYFIGFFQSIYAFYSIAMIMFWTFAGFYFGRAIPPLWKGFLLGNSLWLLSLLLFFHQFQIMTEEGRSVIIAALAQVYVTAYTPITALVVEAADNTVVTEEMIMYPSYMLMLFNFVLGFAAGVYARTRM
ncbi:hypothetical protein [Salisediminibacterium halotolerans]|uniref:Uncharacterized protein n=1 Tax=Salisediminibacterium halotolerans TaxID=517425 RepID=A0A1H9V2J0_9BACI|nr:hypothetical protein [Salisediminibacterium haloalkalitolerans]SES15892.1 hypothetical protein SAMN05444126_11756 [Salisediminibacterium haloalkalitolerans]